MISFAEFERLVRDGASADDAIAIARVWFAAWIGRRDKWAREKRKYRNMSSRTCPAGQNVQPDNEHEQNQGQCPAGHPPLSISTVKQVVRGDVQPDKIVQPDSLVNGHSSAVLPFPALPKIRKKTVVPDTWKPKPETLAKLRAKGFPQSQIEHELERFINNSHIKEVIYAPAQFDRALVNWMTNKYAEKPKKYDDGYR